MPQRRWGPELKERLIGELLARRADRLVVGAIAALLVAAGFLAGRWSAFTRQPVPIVFREAPAGGEATNAPAATFPPPPPPPSSTPSPPPAAAAAPAKPWGAFVASVKGGKYYYPSCRSARRIKKENLIWFDSEQEAREAGYQPSQCVQKAKR